jgi:ABC-type transporter Mla subunit MlaD
MDDWSKQFLDALSGTVNDLTQQMADDTERWLDSVTNQLASASEALVQVTDEWAEQVQEVVDPEIDRVVNELNQVLEPFQVSFNAQLDDVAQQLDEVLGPFVLGLSGLDQWFEEVSGPLNSTVEPLLQNYPACVGCRNFYGQAYGGNTLVCAMHPFGPEEEHHCDDWESVWPQPPNEG